VLAVKALPHVPDATLLLVGDGPLRADVEAAATEAGVDGRVVLAGERPDARALVAAADVALLASSSEGLPLAALEALAAGTPVAATAVRGVRELLADGETALLVPPGDAEALAAAARRLLDDAELRHSLAARGLEEADRHTEDAMVQAYLRTYGALRR
jgi:glycosyltransferase involved in cell wall biosynthesis